MKWYERLFLAVVVFFTAVGLVWQQHGIALSFARTAAAEEGLMHEHAEYRRAAKIQASWSSCPLTMSVCFPYHEKAEFRRELDAMLADFQPRTCP